MKYSVRPCLLAKGGKAFFNFLTTHINPCLWVTLLIVSLLSVVDIMSYYIDRGENPLMVCGLVGFAGLKATLLTMLVSICKKKRLLHVAAIVIVAVYVVLSLVNGISFILYGLGISRKMFLVVSETNRSEVKEFLSLFPASVKMRLFSKEALYGIILVAALYLFAYMCRKKLFSVLAVVFSLVGVSYAVFYVSNYQWGRSNHLVALRTASCYMSFRKSTDKIREMVSHHKELPYASTALSSHYAKNVVLVIGESASRSHHSIYGYRLPTTPHLDTISSGLFVFTDALASSPWTAENIPRILSFMTDEPDEKEWYEYPTVIQLMKKMGYRVGWISNQEKIGEYANVSAIISMEADYVDYVGAIDSEDHLAYKYDELVLPSYETFMTGPDSLKFACIHLMGSHVDFKNRYPKARKVFDSSDILRGHQRKWLDGKKAELIADYDNSILYTDSILNEIISSIRNLEEPSVMVYLSDHGHTVYDRRDYFGRDELASEVPFIVYVNKAYMQLHPAIAESLARSKEKPLSTSETIHLLISLTGGHYRFYKPTSDPLSDSFIIRQRYFDGEAI